jgi:hypothetical protein
MEKLDVRRADPLEAIIVRSHVPLRCVVDLLHKVRPSVFHPQTPVLATQIVAMSGDPIPIVAGP